MIYSNMNLCALLIYGKKRGCKMPVFFAIFVLLCLYKIRIKPDETGFQSDYMSVEKTSAIKGIFIIIVFFSHFYGYVSLTWAADEVFYKYFNMIGQRMVTLFLFYSGYGVMESISRKGINYVHSIPRRRLLHVLAEFDIAVVIFTVIRLIMKTPFAGGDVFSIKQFFLSLIAWDSVGNSNWYIFSILIAYAATFIGFEIFKCRKIPSVAAVTVLLAAFIVFLRLTGIKEPYWYNTVICYAGGMWFSLLRPAVEKIMFKNAVWIPVFILSLALCLASFRLAKANFLLYELSMCLFAWTVVVFTMKISVCNKALVWLGKNLFPMYIFQRVPMIIFERLGLAEFNIYIYFAVCFALTVLISVGFSKFSKWLWSPKKS